MRESIPSQVDEKSGVPEEENRVWGSQGGERGKYSFALQDGTWEFSGDAVAGKGLILR